MRNLFLAISLVMLVSTMAPAQTHTLIVLGHNDHSVNEVDTTTGKVLHKFQAVDQPHEAAVSPDGKTIYAAVPSAAHVVILDAATFKEKGKIESPFFHGRTPQPAGARGQRGGQRGGAEGAGAGNRGNALPGVNVPD